MSIRKGGSLFPMKYYVSTIDTAKQNKDSKLLFDSEEKSLETNL